MTKQGLDKMAERLEYARKIRELLDEAVEKGHDEEAILELVTGDDEE